MDKVFLIKRYLMRCWENILDLIYPPKCILCEKLLVPFEGHTICETCAPYFRPITGNLCNCGRPFLPNCEFCQTHLFEKNIGVYAYEGMAQELIYRFKFRKKPYIAKGMAKLMLSGIDASYIRWADVILAVPIHKKRHRSRGFNQADLLARAIARELELDSPRPLILRKKYTQPLSAFTPTGRRNVLKSAFVFNKKFDITGKKILIIDDIFTTGATLNALTKVLFENGASRVRCLTFSVVPPKKSDS